MERIQNRVEFGVCNILFQTFTSLVIGTMPTKFTKSMYSWLPSLHPRWLLLICCVALVA